MAPGTKTKLVTGPFLDMLQDDGSAVKRKAADLHVLESRQVISGGLAGC